MIELLLVLVIVGVVLYLIGTIPMDPVIVVVIRVVVVVMVCLWLLRAFGVMDVPVPRLR